MTTNLSKSKILILVLSFVPAIGGLVMYFSDSRNGWNIWLVWTLVGATFFWIVVSAITFPIMLHSEKLRTKKLTQLGVLALDTLIVVVLFMATDRSNQTLAGVFRLGVYLMVSGSLTYSTVLTRLIERHSSKA